jgi:hypothetical protein
VETSSEKRLLKTTSKKSLIQTPITKLNPPALPLLMLCLMMVNMTGPTDITSNNPIATPLSIASVTSII